MKRGVRVVLTFVAFGGAVACAAAVPACSSSGNLDVPELLDGASEASSSLDAASAGLDAGGLPASCADAGVPASTLECTGLYSDFANKVVVGTAKAYAPATPLWADGAGKSRWIQLPAGTTIDVTDPNEWTFPIGTKVWKEFALGGQRLETRMFQKLTSTYWVHATYKWSVDASSATISFGEDVPTADGGTWSIPTPDQCDQCHHGRSDRILGFEQVGLGLSGATGLTLAQLVTQGLLTPAPTNVNLTIGDDGTGKDAPALAWIHENCGITCHNANEGSSGYGAGMLLRLDPTLLDGRPAVGWDPLRTTIGVHTVSGSLQGETRIAPGDAADSAIIQVISTRGSTGIQMPPIASKFVDTVDVAAVTAWVNALPYDAGPPDSGPLDSGIPDADTDSSIPDAAPDATLDAGPPADSAPDAPLDDATAPPDASPDASDASPLDSSPD